MNNFELIQIAQGSQEWLDLRMNYLGASEAASAIGVCPFRTPNQLWQEKWGFIAGPEENDAMRRGKLLEHDARCAFTEITHIGIAPAVAISTRYPWMLASSDGLSVDCKTAVELKCPGLKTHEIALDGEIPDYYKPQLLHTLEVLGLDKMYYESYFPDHPTQEVKILEFYRSDVSYDLVAKEKIFWDMVQDFVQPELTDRDYVKHYDIEFCNWSQIYHHLDSEIKSLEKKKSEVKALLLGRAQENSVEGPGIRITRFPVRGQIDKDRVIKENLPDVDLELYRKKSTIQWRIS